MSLHCVGSQLLQTPPSPLLAGASTASLSIWIRINPGTAVANPAGVLLFGDSGGRVAVGLSGSGDLRVGWSSNDGKADGSSEWEQYLLPGVTYHLAATWQDGVQNYYVNGILVSSDARHGSLGRLGDHLPHPFRIGSDVTGVDVDLDEATLWVGYALTAQDVVGLRDRSGHPEGIAPGSIALRWTLGGPDGLPVRVGDAGLSDASATGLNLSAIAGSAPTYRGGVLSYAARDSNCTASVCPSGRGVLFLSRNEASIPIAVQSLSDQNEVQSAVLSGTPAGPTFTLSLDGHLTAPIAYVVNPPLAYFEWALTLPRPGAYDLAIDIPNNSGNSPTTLYEVFDGTTPNGTTTLNLTTPAGLNQFTDGSVNGRGDPLAWTPLGRFTFVGTSAKLRVSAPKGIPNDVILYADCLRVLSAAAGSTAFYVGPQVPPGAHANQFSANDTSRPDILAKDGGRSWNDTGAGVFDYASVDPAAVRAALEALPNVGVGNVTVSGNASFVVVANRTITPTPLAIGFVGTFAGRAVSLLVSSDPAFVIKRIAAGGNWPIVKKNGVALPPLSNPRWGTGHGDSNNPTVRTDPPYLPYVYFPFLQSQPDARYEPIGSHHNIISGSWDPRPAGYSPNPSRSNDPGARATWLDQGIGPATYRLSATWTADPGNSTDAVFTVVNRAGATVATYHVNQSGAPDGPVDGGVPWHVLGTITTTAFVDDFTVTLTNASTGTMVADALRFERTSPDLSVQIGPGDVLTYSSGLGWAVTAAGPASAVVDAPVANLVGGSIVPAVPNTPKTMGVGWNIYLCFPSIAPRPYTDATSGWSNPDPDHTTTDANSNLTSFRGTPGDTRASLGVGLLQQFQTIAGDRQGGANVESGHWTLVYTKGQDSLALSGTEVGTETVAPDGTHRRIFDNQPPPGYYSPSISLVYQSTRPAAPGSGTFLHDATNIHVYPPSVDPNNPSKYDPGFLDKIRWVQSLRFLDPNGAITSNNLNFSDYAPLQSRIGRNDRQTRKLVGIASVTAYPFNGSHPYDSSTAPAYLFTTTVPHGMSNGFHVQHQAESGPVTLSDGSTYSLANKSAEVTVLSPTTYSCQFGPRPAAGAAPIAMVGTVGNVGGQVFWDSGNGFSIQDQVELCNFGRNGVGADLYLNTGHTTSLACQADLATYIATHIKPGAKVRHEFSNEPWNYYSYPYGYLTAESYAAGKSSGFYVPAYCDLAAKAWAAFRAAWVAAGRDPADHLRVLGGASAVPSLADQYIEYCRANGIAFDRIALAPYMNNGAAGGPSEVTWADVNDRLVAAQDLDIFEANFTYTDQDTPAKQTRAKLDTAGLTHVGVDNYEGGPASMVMYLWPNRPPSRFIERSHAAHRDPRWFGIIGHHLQSQQDAGVGTYHFYYLGGAGDFIESGPTCQMWSACTSNNQPLGTGDPILDAANRATPDRMDLIKSETAGALTHWGALVLKPSPTKPATSRRLIPGPLRAQGHFRRPFKANR